MHKRFLLLTFFLFFINATLWVFLVPVWHFPDEQSHFAQATFIAIKGRNPFSNDQLDLTEEIHRSEVYLGTERDQFGNNKFTFHPEFRIEYTDSLFGKYENEISALANTPAAYTFVKKDASLYPILYYLPGAYLIRLFFSSDLFVRAYLVRFWSVFLFILTLYVIFKLGNLIFAGDKIHPLILAVLVGFQPMMVFANVGVNSDSLGNLVFTVYLYLSTLILIKGSSIRKILGLIFFVFLSMYIKTQFYILMPLLIILICVLILRDYKGGWKKILVLLPVIFLIVGVFIDAKYKFIGGFPLLRQYVTQFNLYSFAKFSTEYTLNHTYREVLPWYWGIYNWLGVTYPRLIHRAINWVILVSGTGLLIFILNFLRLKSHFSRKFQAASYLVFVSTIYFIAISFFDWFSWYKSGFQLGVQGRYFFPVISVSMLMLLVGWRSLFWFKRKVRILGIKLLGILMMLLNIYALYTVSKAYYDLSSVRTFILQASQYKPWFVKGIGFVIVLLAFFIALSKFLLEYVRYPHEKENH